MAGEFRGWHSDPYGLHELRYFSLDGMPTRLVRDGSSTSSDPPPPSGLLATGLGSGTVSSNTENFWSAPVKALPPEEADSNVQQNGQILYLHGLRALAALYVAVHHFFLTVFPTAPTYVRPTGWTGAVTGWMVYGHFGVSAFIVISGYSLGIGIVRSGNRFKRGTWDFFRKRARRILPPYYAALAISAILAATVIRHHTGTVWDTAIPYTYKDVLAHLFLVQDLYHPNAIDHPLWSIAVEWQLYFLLPIVVWVRRKWDWQRVLPLSVVAGAVTYEALKSVRLSGGYPELFTLFVFGYFAADISLGKYRISARLGQGLAWLGLGLFALSCVVLPFYVPPNRLGNEVWMDFPIGAAIALLIAGMASGAMKPFQRFLSAKFLVAIGIFSYSLYLIHAPLEQLWWQDAVRPLHIGQTAQLGMCLGIGLPLIVGASYLFFRAVESHFLNAGQQQAKEIEHLRL